MKKGNRILTSVIDNLVKARQVKPCKMNLMFGLENRIASEAKWF
jgi:N-acetyl-gamma-glutamylphosphate reductase